MVRGLASNWKYPIFYDFDCPVRKELLNEIIIKLEEIGINIIGMVSDMGSTNKALRTSLNITNSNTSFKNPYDNSRNVYVFADVPHLLKLVRNWLFDRGFKTKEGTKIEKSTIERILQYDDGEIRMCHKITPAHFNCVNNERQRVRLAAQVLSHRVASALRVIPGNEEPQVKATADFCDTINDWFDTFNSSFIRSSKKLASAYGIHIEEQKAALQKMIDLFETISMLPDRRPKKSKPSNEPKNPPKPAFNVKPQRVQFCKPKQKSVKPKAIPLFIQGIITSSKSLISLFDELKERYEMSFILTSRLNQDLVENFFSRIRALGGTHTQPNALEFMQRFRLLVISNSAEFAVPNASVKCNPTSEEENISTSKFLKHIQKDYIEDNEVINESNSLAVNNDLVNNFSNDFDESGNLISEVIPQKIFSRS